MFQQQILLGDFPEEENIKNSSFLRHLGEIIVFGNCLKYKVSYFLFFLRNNHCCCFTATLFISASFFTAIDIHHLLIPREYKQYKFVTSCFTDVLKNSD